MARRAQIEEAPRGGYILYLPHPGAGFLAVEFSGSLEECIERLTAYFKIAEEGEQ
jgi:hypothetical protein